MSDKRTNEYFFINFNNENKTPQTIEGKASKHPLPLNEIKIQQFQ